MWEHWDNIRADKTFWSTDMNSFNHYAYGAVAEWMYAAMAGIAVDPDAPGFKHFVLSPRPDTRRGSELPAGQKPITYVKAHYDSIAGRIESAWDFREGLFTYSFTIPTGTSARVEFPLLNGRDYVVINHQKLEMEQLFGKKVGKKLVFELGAGTYMMQ
jgi:alpha-L-rhamnosidase